MSDTLKWEWVMVKEEPGYIVHVRARVHDEPAWVGEAWPSRLGMKSR